MLSEEFTEEQIRAYLGKVEVTPRASIQFDVTAAATQHNKRSGRVLSEYARVSIEGGLTSVEIRGTILHGYEGCAIMLSDYSFHDISWKVRHRVNMVTLGHEEGCEEIIFKGEKIIIRVSPRVHPGGGLWSSPGAVPPLNVVSVIMLFSNMNENSIWELLDLARDRGRARSTFVSKKDEYTTLFPKSSRESPWTRDNTDGSWMRFAPTNYLRRTNGWGLSLPS